MHVLVIWKLHFGGSRNHSTDSKVRDFGSGKNFDFGIDDADMGCSQTGQRGAIIAECLSIRCSTALAPRSRSVSGLNRQKEGWNQKGLPVYSELYTPA
jgi:hypothetical protein